MTDALKREIRPGAQLGSHFGETRRWRLLESHLPATRNPDKHRIAQDRWWGAH
jgi:hypothetical protein